MLAKYINRKSIERYRGFVILNGRVYVNNIPKAREAGFKDLVIEEQPEYNPEVEYIDFYYEDGEVITQKWEVIPFEEPETNVSDTELNKVDNSEIEKDVSEIETKEEIEPEKVEKIDKK